MLEILKNKKCDKTNGTINFCIISEEELKVMIEIAKRENQELKKYKSLYQNEKSHTDTLKRIIKEVKGYLEGTFEMSTYTKSVYLDEESIEEILDLLKEIK